MRLVRSRKPDNTMPAKKKSPATANRKKPKFHRVLLKISGEVLGGETGGICPESVHDVAAQVRELARLGVQIGVVVGGGNIFRGLQGSEKGIDADVLGCSFSTFTNTCRISMFLGAL